MLFRYTTNKQGKTVQTALVYTKQEHSIQNELIDPEALKIVSHLRTNGFETYIVGGAVRDLLLGKKPKDFDIVTQAEPAKIRRLFRNSRIIGRRFRLVHIFYGDKIYEVSTFRSLIDGSVGNSFGTIEEDVKRRDFTINALYYDPLKEQLVDYVQGLKDIREKKINPIIPLKNIFTEDPVRMIRAVKYACSADCDIPNSLKRTIKKHSSLLETVSPSRLTEEIIKIVNSGCAHSIVNKALYFNLYVYIQPNATSLIDDSSKFLELYLKSLNDLDVFVAGSEKNRLGQKLKFIIKDFVDLIIPQEGGNQEIYKFMYSECRRFVLPMNPPRVELEVAVKSCLKDHGIIIKKAKQKAKKS